MISLEITEDIASKLRFLTDSGLFGMKTGSMTIHFKDGDITTVKTEHFTYNKKLSTPAIPFDLLNISPIL